MTLVDTNVLLDVFTEDPKWLGWSLTRLEEAALRGPLLINDVIYAETSTRYPAIEDFESALAGAGVTVAAIPRRALFLALARLSRSIGAPAAFAAACSLFFYRGPCSHRTAAAADPRCAALSKLFSESRVDRAAGRLKNKLARSSDARSEVF